MFNSLINNQAFTDLLPIAILTIIKSSRPLLRKDLMTKINEEQYLVMNSIFVLVILILFYYFRQLNSFFTGKALNQSDQLSSFGSLSSFSLFGSFSSFSQFNPFNSVKNDYLNLDTYNKIIILVLAVMTVSTTMVTFRIEKSTKKSTNLILMKLLGPLSTIAMAYYINKKKITNQTLAGYFIAFVGLIIIGQENQTA